MKPFSDFITFVHHEWVTIGKKKHRVKRLADIMGSDLFKTRTVLNGPFKGMHYPVMQSAGSSLSPKLLGTYEMELHQLLNEFCKNDYSDIIDIGCAEGYYAVGMAMRIPNAKVHAFDTNPKARELCKKMAEVNGVANRVHVSGTCTASMLENFSLKGRGLVICDCEGFESQLFNRQNLQHLRNCDIIIETHDFIDLHISPNLKEMIAPTHSITSIFSVDDLQKVHLYHLEALKSFSLEDRKELLAEERSHVMEWLICTPRA